MTVVRHFVCSRILVNEEALAYRGLRAEKKNIKRTINVRVCCI
jgi:hypothetical protein